MCKVLKVSKSGYYHWCNRSISKREKENTELLKEIIDIYNQSNSTYGSPRIQEELHRRGYKVSRPKVARLMRNGNIQSKIRKKWVVTTDSKHKYQGKGGRTTCQVCFSELNESEPLY